MTTGEAPGPGVVGRRSAGGVLRGLALLVATLTVIGIGVGAGSPAAAHDDIAGSDPAHRSLIDEPISRVSVDFGVGVSDDTVMFLVYDRGDGTFEDIGGETIKTGPNTADLVFDELDRQGTYTVRYIAPVPIDAHVIQGSISFTWGVPTGEIPEDPNLLRVSPPGRAVLADPISNATLTFIDDVDVSNVRLIYDEGDGSTFPDVDSDWEQTAPDTIELTFDPLEDDGTYFIAYQADSATTGEEFAGATSFSIGQPSTSNSGDGFPVVPFTVAAVAILALGALGTLALARRAALAADEDGDDDDRTDGDDDPSDPDDGAAVTDSDLATDHGGETGSPDHAGDDPVTVTR